MNILFDGIAQHFNMQKEYTNPRVSKNIDLLEKLRATNEPVVLTPDYKTMNAVRFLNRKGLLKYSKRDNGVLVYPTLLFFYLTLILKYDTYTTYKECIKLYHVIGDKLNNIKPE